MGEVLAIVGAGVGIIGGQEQAGAQAAAFEYQQEVNENNKKIADKLAVDAIERGKISEKGFRRGLESFKGKQRAAFAKSGVVIDQDTALDVLLDTAEMGEIDALTIRNNAEREAFGFRAQGEGFNSAAAIAGAQASSAQAAGNINAVTNILGAANKIYGQNQ